MADVLSVQVSRASSIDRDEDTTRGFIVTLQLGPLVFEFWATSLPFWEKKA